MKLKCISNRLKYVAFDQSGKPHRVTVGETFRVDAKEIPAKWRGLVTEVPDGPDATAPRSAVTNPEDGAINQPSPERFELMGEACEVLEDKDFNDDGVPKVNAINGVIPESAEKFKAEERDAIWPHIADQVKAERAKASA